MLPYITKVTRSGANSSTLRTSIPNGLVRLLDIQAGDELEWQFEFDHAAKKAIVSKKFREAKISDKQSRKMDAIVTRESASQTQRAGIVGVFEEI